MKLNKILCLIGVLSLVACGGEDNRIFDKNLDIPEGKWDRSFIPEFKLEIDDVNASYDFFYNIRHTQDYPYHNLYVHYYLMDKDRAVMEEEIHEMYLFNPQTGAPSTNVIQEGSVGALYFNTFLCIKGYQFDKPGTYYFKIKNHMRSTSLQEDVPLKEIFSVGLRVDKIKK